MKRKANKNGEEKQEPPKKTKASESLLEHLTSHPNICSLFHNCLNFSEMATLKRIDKHLSKDLFHYVETAEVHSWKELQTFANAPNVWERLSSLHIRDVHCDEKKAEVYVLDPTKFSRLKHLSVERCTHMGIRIQVPLHTLHLKKNKFLDIRMDDDIALHMHTLIFQKNQLVETSSFLERFQNLRSLVLSVKTPLDLSFLPASLEHLTLASAHPSLLLPAECKQLDTLVLSHTKILFSPQQAELPSVRVLQCPISIVNSAQRVFPNVKHLQVWYKHDDDDMIDLTVPYEIVEFPAWEQGSSLKSLYLEVLDASTNLRILVPSHNTVQRLFVRLGKSTVERVTIQPMPRLKICSLSRTSSSSSSFTENLLTNVEFVGDAPSFLTECIVSPPHTFRVSCEHPSSNLSLILELRKQYWKAILVDRLLDNNLFEDACQDMLRVPFPVPGYTWNTMHEGIVSIQEKYARLKAMIARAHLVQKKLQEQLEEPLCVDFETFVKSEIPNIFRAFELLKTEIRPRLVQFSTDATSATAIRNLIVEMMQQYQTLRTHPSTPSTIDGLLNGSYSSPDEMDQAVESNDIYQQLVAFQTQLKSFPFFHLMENMEHFIALFSELPSWNQLEEEVVAFEALAKLERMTDE